MVRFDLLCFASLCFGSPPLGINAVHIALLPLSLVIAVELACIFGSRPLRFH